MAGEVSTTCSAADDPMPEKPLSGAAMHQAPAQQVPPQQQPADNSTVIPDPVQQQGMASQMQRPQTPIQEQAQGLQAVPMSGQAVQPGQPLGSSVLAPSLQPLIAMPYSAASGRKVSRQCIPEEVGVLTSYQNQKACHLTGASSTSGMAGASRNCIFTNVILTVTSESWLGLQEGFSPY